MRKRRVFILILTVPLVCGGCGALVPEKNLLSPDHIDNPETGASSGGRYEDVIVRHIVCEIASGIWEATQNPYFYVPWLKRHDWGTSVTLTITVTEQEALNPGVSFATPLANRIFTFPSGGSVTAPQSFSFGVGASASANATRTETIQFTYANDVLWTHAKLNANPKNGTMSCEDYQKGIFVAGDLKIRQFIYDKAVIATANNVSSANNGYPPFNTFTDDVTFIASFGGNITPTWKLARISANTTGTLLSGSRTSTNEVIVTIGPIETYASEKKPAQLAAGAQNQHNAHVQARANATAITGN
jgi:hypothetical protein